ncbi:hypothetical protein F511_45370 [Dorcoceras hygrometricum]|uniref:Uncharacterized protein n=1 Tax=Dorcoceras hygrometricum TaxID=472368 RepID=A0A2Z6ZW66_9LAMI|nr:hypothetical protein F511_45370 [Dorcoceras hygrometricum]
MPRCRRAWRRPSACACAQAAARDERAIAGRRCYSFAQMLRGIAPWLVNASRTMLRPFATRWPAVGATLIVRVLSGGAQLTARLRRWRLDVGWPLLRVVDAVCSMLRRWKRDGRTMGARCCARSRVGIGVALRGCRCEIFHGGGRRRRPPLRQSSGDVVTADFF